jgi:hypothetical protein
MKSQELRAKRYVSLEQNMPRKKRGDLKEFWHLVMSEDSKYASEYQKMEVKEFRFNAVGKEAY